MTEVEASKAVARGPQVWPLSVKAYHALTEMGLVPKQTELLYGQVYHKMSKSPLHSFLALRLLRLLQALVPTGYLCRPEQPITCQDSEPEPDLAVVRGREEDYRQEHPRTAELVIEVCVTSHDYDRSKLRAYANAGVKECWFVLAQNNQIEVHRQPAGDQFAERAVRGPGGQLASSAVPEIALDLDVLFAK
jgi:Uma2 family endonuclease